MQDTIIRFGTDGWRGTIAEDYTFTNVRRCAQGFANYLLEQQGASGRSIVVGYDKRFGSERFAAAAAEVLAANNIPVLLTEGATPTPVISYAVVANGAAGAINITASHNPGSDNGFKVRNQYGGAIDPAGLKQIEARIPPSEAVKRLDLEEAQRRGLVRLFDPAPAYLEHLKDLIDVEPIKRAGLTVVVDAMWGNGAGWFPRLLGDGATRIIEIHNHRNPIFPEMTRPEPIPPNVNAALAKVREVGADIAIITDGDADRIGVGDENGGFIDQLRVYALLVLYLLEVRGERGPIVKTLSTTSMLNKLGQLYHVPVYETGVGFKYVAPKMLETNAMIGGEESGGYAFRHHVPERDGILAGLFMLDFLVRTGRKPTELIADLFSKVGAHYYERVDLHFPMEQREAIQQRILTANPERIGGLRVTGLNTTDGYKFGLEDGGWLLIRFSGTEPILRVYTETTHQDLVQPILDDGVKLLGLSD